MEINLLDELKIEHTAENFIKADKRYNSLLNTYILSVFKEGEELNVEGCYSRLLKDMENLTIDISKEKDYFVERIDKELNKSSLYYRHDGYFKKKAVRPPLPGEDIIRSYKNFIFNDLYFGSFIILINCVILSSGVLSNISIILIIPLYIFPLILIFFNCSFT